MLVCGGKCRRLILAPWRCPAAGAASYSRWNLSEEIKSVVDVRHVGAELETKADLSPHTREAFNDEINTPGLIEVIEPVVRMGRCLMSRERYAHIRHDLAHAV